MKTKFLQTALVALALVATGVNALPVIKAEFKPDKRNNFVPEREVIDRIEYDFAKASIRDNYYSDLNQLAIAIINQKYAISLRGHADSVGSYVANWKLSEKRALEVKEYLKQKGVDEKRIVTTPYGSTEPIASNKTSEGRQKNRRVEVKLRKLND